MKVKVKVRAPRVKSYARAGARTVTIMSAGEGIEEILQRLPLKAAIVTDQEGVVLLRAGGDGADLGLQRMAVTFAQNTEHASKLLIGKCKLVTTFYGAFH